MPVSDDPAVTFALEFYSHALTGRPAADFVTEKRSARGRKTRVQKPDVCEPDTLGKALEEARRSILFQGSTWGAYQHYGVVNTRLLRGLTNTPAQKRTKRQS